MKRNLLLLIFLFSVNTVMAQMSHTLSPETVSYYQKAISGIPPSVDKLIQETALAMDRKQFNFDSLCNAIRQNKTFQKYSAEDCHKLSLLILIRCSMNAETALKKKVLQSGKEGDQEDLKYENMEALLKRKSDLAEMVSVQMKKL